MKVETRMGAYRLEVTVPGQARLPTVVTNFFLEMGGDTTFSKINNHRIPKLRSAWPR